MPDVVDLAMDTTDYYAPATQGTSHRYVPAEEGPEVSVPLTKSGKPDGRSRAARAASGRAPQGPSQRRTPAAKAPRSKDYRAGIEGIGQLAGGALFFVAPADAAAVMLHTPPIAAALNDLAQQDPRVAAMLDKLLAVGPYGALLAAVMPLVLQILTNHGKIPAGVLGTHTPDELIGAVLGGVQ